MSHTVRVKCVITPGEIMYLNHVIDGYDGIGIVRTVDKALGKVVIYATEGTWPEVVRLLESLRDDEGVDIRDIHTEQSEEIDVW